MTGLVTATLRGHAPEQPQPRRARAALCSARTMPDGGTVDSLIKAVDVASARAMRKGLRVVSFDPVRAHEASKAGQDLPLNVTDPRSSELAEIHMIAGQIGLIKGEDKTAYRRLIGVYFAGKDSAAQLTDGERAQFLAHLRGMQAAHERSLMSSEKVVNVK